jgi:phage-related minor tail protein
MDAGARGSAEYYKALANQRGVDANTLKPYLDQLEAVKVKQSQAAAAMVSGGKSLDNVGISARQTAAALRQVPAQLTDIVVSLQAGQAPMTVLLQQGGQLKDMFGGIGPTARALGGYVMGMVNPFTAAAAAGATLAVAAYQGAQESKAFTDTLITTGNQAGVTAGRLMLIAQSLDSVAGTQGNAAAVLNQLAATGQVTAAGLQLAAQAAIEFERAGGQAAEKTVQGFAELGKAPLAATIKLNESMGYLTSSTYEQIKSLEEQGRTADAAALAQKAFADALLTRAPEMLANMGYLETGWVNIKDAVKEAWDGIKNIGRDAGVEGQSASVGAAIARLEGVIRTKTQGGYNTQMFDAELAKLKERQSILQSDERLLRSAADHQAQQTREVEARVKWDKDGAQYLDKKVKMEREITQAISEGTKAKATQADIDARVAAIREKYKEKAGPKTSFVPGADNAREWETYLKAFGAAAVDAEGKVSGLTKTQGKLIEYLGSGAYLNMPEPARQTALQAAYAAIATEQQVEATKHQAQAWTEANKAALAYGKQLDDMALAGADLIAQATSYAAAIDQQVAATEFEASLIGQSNVQRGIALKQYQIELETKKEIARINATLASQADRDAAISAVKAAGDKAKASAAAEVVNQEFNRTSDKIEQDLTDALMRGFESGKGFAENLRDTVANMFKTLVLRPVIQATVQGGLNAVGLGSLGGQGAGSNLLGNVAGNYLTSSLGTAVFGNSAAYGAALGTTSIGAGSQAAMLAAQTGEFGLAGLGATSAAAGGTMASIGAAMPYIGAALAVASLLKGLDDSGTMHTGGLGSYSAARGSSTGDAVKAQGLGFDLSSNDYNAATAQASVGIAQAVAGMLDSTAATFGQKAGYFAATAWADDTSDDGGWGALMVKLGDQVLLDWKNGTDKWPGREFSDGEAGAKEYAAAVATDVRDYLITQTPAWADTMLTALGDAPSLEQLAATVAQINQVQNALEGMGQASAAFAGLTEAATSALVASLGGAEASVASLSAYYGNFYSESERAAITTANLTTQLADLGQAMPDTREAFRAMVDAAVAAGDTDLAAKLLQLSPAFASVSEAAKEQATAAADAAKAVEDLTNRFTSAKNSLIADGASLAVDLLTAQGDTAGAAALQRGQYLAGFADLDAARLAELAAIYDTNQAIRDQITATEKANTVAEQRKGLEAQILQAQGDTTAVRALELAALDESLRPLQERLYALADEAVLTEKANAAAQLLAATNADIQKQIDLLTGAQTERSIQLSEATDSSTKALLLNLYALQDTQAATAKAAQAEGDLIQARSATAQAIYADAQAATGAAQALLNRSAQAERDGITTARSAADASKSAAQSVVQELQGVFDALTTNIRTLYAEVASTTAMGASAGRAFIDDAVANALATGYMPDSKSLQDAVDSVRNSMGDDQYASVTARDRDRLVLAGKLSQLADIAAPQLSSAEQAVKIAEAQLTELDRQTETLDKTLRTAEDELDALRGIDTGTTTVASAIAALQLTVIAESQAQTAALGASLVAAISNVSTRPQDAVTQYETQTGGSVARDQWIDAAGTQAWLSAGGAAALGGTAAGGAVPTDPRSATIYGIAGQQTTVGGAQDFIAQAQASGDLRSIYDAAIDYGISSSAVDALGGFAPGAALEWAKANGLPLFERGTNYTQEGLAYLHRGEAVVPAAYNPAAGGQSPGNTRLERLVEGLTAEVQRLQAIVRDGNENTRQLADQFDNVTEGGNATRTVAI